MTDNDRQRSSRQLLTRLRGALDAQELDVDTRELSNRILNRTERVVGHLEGAAETLETIVKLELSLLRRMVPIVEDLGELMRHTLDDARQRRGLSPRGHHRDDVIDVQPDE
ncbi:MAG: hypothetical protein ACPGU1_00225 [Myxococcota bacterium]